MSTGPLLPLAVIVTAGIVGGEIAARLRIPRVTGWIITGVVLRALAFEVLEPTRLTPLKPLADFVLGYIAFTVGSHLHLSSLINAQRRLLFIALTELILTPVVVVLVMTGIGGLEMGHSLLFAAIAVAGAPGTTVIVIREARARGVFVKTLIGSVALIDMVAVCVFVVSTELVRASGHIESSLLPEALVALARTVGLALAAAALTAGLTVVLTRAVVGPALLGTCLVAAILLGWGLAEWLEVSSILTVTLVGAILANVMPDKERAGEAYLNTFGSVLFTAFYTLAGTRLNFTHVIPMASLIGLFFAARLVGKNLSAFTAMTLARAPQRVRQYLGFALLPHGRVEMGEEVAGVVGLSKDGFRWDTPDGRPVHAIVVLATPEGKRDRHLEVLASFAKAISSDQNIQEQLYRARTAAHAYDILHAEASEDFNYFLEDALEQDVPPNGAVRPAT